MRKYVPLLILILLAGCMTTGQKIKGNQENTIRGELEVTAFKKEINKAVSKVITKTSVNDPLITIILAITIGVLVLAIMALFLMYIIHTGRSRKMIIDALKTDPRTFEGNDGKKRKQ